MFGECSSCSRRAPAECASEIKTMPTLRGRFHLMIQLPAFPHFWIWTFSANPGYHEFLVFVTFMIFQICRFPWFPDVLDFRIFWFIRFLRFLICVMCRFLSFSRFPAFRVSWDMVAAVFDFVDFICYFQKSLFHSLQISRIYSFMVSLILVII